MRLPHAAILALSLSRIAQPASPLLNAAQPNLKRTAAAATGQARTAMLAGATHVTASAAAARAAPSAGWLTQRSCHARHRRPSIVRSWGQGSSGVYSTREEGRDSPKGGDPRVHTTAAAHVRGTRSRKKNLQQQQQQQACRLGEEGGEEEDRDWGKERKEEESLAVSSRLQNVVDQLQGEIKAGATPQVRSRIQLDGLFAELRAEPVEGSASIMPNPTATTAAAAAATVRPEALAVSTAPEQQQQQSPSGTFRPAPLPRGPLQGSQDLESLSDMLNRVQANTKARDLAQAQAHSLAIRSGGPIGGDPKKSWVAIGNQRDMKTRFKRIREGRVGWAILPLLIKAREAGIPLSTGVYNAAIAAYSGTPKNYEEALRVLNMLRREEDPFVRPDLGSYNAAMWVCSEAGQWRLVMEVGWPAKKTLLFTTDAPPQCRCAKLFHLVISSTRQKSRVRCTSALRSSFARWFARHLRVRPFGCFLRGATLLSWAVTEPLLLLPLVLLVLLFMICCPREAAKHDRSVMKSAAMVAFILACRSVSKKFPQLLMPLLRLPCQTPSLPCTTTPYPCIERDA